MCKMSKEVLFMLLLVTVLALTSAMPLRNNRSAADNSDSLQLTLKFESLIDNLHTIEVAM